MTPEEFVARWHNTTLNERQSYQMHFSDVCRMVGYQAPSGSGYDNRGNTYRFEESIETGFADVYLEGHFAIEYKAPNKYKDLNAAYDQLLRYREQLKNPPLLIVTDIEKWQIHTNFEGTEKRVYEFKHEDIATSQRVRDYLEAIFAEPKRLHPLRNTAEVTKDAARGFQQIADNMRAWDADPARIARFLTKLVFCLFAEDIHLLPSAPNSERGIFSELVHQFRAEPPRFRRYAEELFKAMASGGDVLMAQIPYFNGSLFENIDVEQLELEALTELNKVSQLNWASIEPAIFGTLFERALDKKKRAQLGAHYTSRDDILLIIEPVLMTPLRRQWADVKAQAVQLQADYAQAATPKDRININKKREALRDDLLNRLRTITVLDPACGSGNFLYVALQSLMTLEKEIILDAVWGDMKRPFPEVHPRQMYGIEKDPIAHALASIVVWIGYIQWRRNNGYSGFGEPILEDLHDNIRNIDAILTLNPNPTPGPSPLRKDMSPSSPLLAERGGDLGVGLVVERGGDLGVGFVVGEGPGVGLSVESDIGVGSVVRPSADLWDKLKPFAREMRKTPTPAEDILWQNLRKKQVTAHRFRRQHAIDRFIVDFYCAAAQLVIEVDGSIHDEPDQQEYDGLRQEALESMGLRILRFRNEDVLQKMSDVLETIRTATLNEGKSSPLLAERGGDLGVGLVVESDLGVGLALEPEWPPVDVIIGNPPFLGGSKLRGELGDAYYEALTKLYQGRVLGGADLVTYWFEKARAHIEAGKAKRVGLLATNSIRGGANREVLKRIKQTGDIFLAHADRGWILEGAAVRVSMVGFDDGSEKERQYFDRDATTPLSFQAINPDLTASVDITAAHQLLENASIAFRGNQKGGAFDISTKLATEMLKATNNSGKLNSNVIRKCFNGSDIVGLVRDKCYLIDFGTMPQIEAAQYEVPFSYVEVNVKPVREKNPVRSERENWWLSLRSRPEMRKAIAPLKRYIVTPHVSKHRMMVWLDQSILPDHQLIAIARDDDYFFGVLHSKLHEVWSLRMGTWLGKGNDPRYTPTTTFETFPFPYIPGKEPFKDPCYQAIAQAARDLNTQRELWLNPPLLAQRGGAGGGVKSKDRTLTNLYNALNVFRGKDKMKTVAAAGDFAPRLDALHNALDQAVCAAYGWEASILDDEEAILSKLLALNLSRAGQG